MITYGTAPSCTYAGVPTSFNITVRPATSIIVDMYILMDLSSTMVQRLSSLRLFAGALSECVSVWRCLLHCVWERVTFCVVFWGAEHLSAN